MREKLMAKTEKGDLIIEEMGDKECPGFRISYRPAGYVIDKVLATIDQPADFDDVTLCVYGNPEFDGWTHEHTICISDIKTRLDNEMDAINRVSPAMYVNARRRMCDLYIAHDCKGCPINEHTSFRTCSCRVAEEEYTEEFVATVLRWDRSHPETNR